MSRADCAKRGNDLLGVAEHGCGYAPHTGNEFLVIDRIAGAATLAWLSLLDRICGPEPPTPADEKREANQQRKQAL